MTAQTNVSVAPTTSSATFLQKALRGNGIFSLLSGLTFVLASSSVANFLGGVNSTVIMVLGIGLLIFAADLFYVARQNPVKRLYAWLFIEADVLWVIGSAVLLMTNWVEFTSAGWWAVAIVADIVAVFAILQYIGLRRQEG